MEKLNTFLHKYWRYIILMFAFLGGLGSFILGFLISKTKPETRVFFGLFIIVSNMCSSLVFFTLVNKPIYSIFPEIAFSMEEAFVAIVASLMVFIIGILIGSFPDALTKDLYIKKLRVPSRMVVTIGIMLCIKILLEATSILDPLPTSQILQILDRDLSQQDIEKINQVIIENFNEL